MSEEQNLEQLMQAFDGHQVTGEEGQIAESETASEVVDAQETTEEESAQDTTPERTQEPETPKQEHEEAEQEVAEDDSGKRYIPEKKAKKWYAKMKQYERELEATKKASTQSSSPTLPPTPPVLTDKTEILEVELLKDRMPQFDPESDVYSPELDELGYTYLKANPGISRIQAAKWALQTAKGISSKQDQVRQEARLVKSLQSDAGITKSSASRGNDTVDPSSMSLDEMEAYLKKSGGW